MALRLVLRSYGGDNRKNRPAYYDKDVALASFVRAAQAVTADVVFVNDGPIPAQRRRVMESAGRVVDIPGGPVGMRGSYVFGLDLPDAQGWDDGDVVSFCEDDYLFAADAFVALDEAARELPEASYFALTGRRPDDLSDPVQRREHAATRDWAPAPDREIGGRRWINVMSTTSTFAARVGALRADRDIFAACMRPFRNRFLDHETCLLYQGVVPYHGRELLTGLPGDFEPDAHGWARALVRTVVLVPWRIGWNRRARRQTDAHLLYAPAINVATHMEDGCVSPGRDWAAEAADVRRWAARRAEAPGSAEATATTRNARPRVGRLRRADAPVTAAS